MKIKEVEQMLNIPKATIRFYEKEGLLTPQRNENSYRDYSIEDIEILKKIIVLRKIGISLEDIKMLLTKNGSFQEVLSRNMQNLYAQIEEIEGAIKVCSLMQTREENIDSLDEEYYWNVICEEEQNGQTFIDVAKDYLLFEAELLDNVSGGGNKRFISTLLILLCAAVVRGCVSYFTGTGFWEGFNGAFIVLFIVSLIYIPAFLLRKNKKAKEMYIRAISIVAMLFLLVLFIFIIFQLL